jgi:MFS family permease
MTHRSAGLFYGWFVVAGASLALFLSYGAVYAFGSFFTTLQDAFDANRAGVAGLFAVTVAIITGFGIITGPLADRVGPRPMVIAGGVLVGAGLIAAGRTTSLWQLYLAYGGGVGLGGACILVPCSETVQHWFVRRRGFASGLAVAGIGVGNLVGPPAAALLLREFNWRTVFVILGVIVAAGIIAASRLLSPSPEARGLRPDGDPPPATAAIATAAGPAAGGMAVRQALRARTFWLFYAALLAAGFGAFIPFAHLVPDAETHGISRVTASSLLGLVGAGSLAGRFVIGPSADRLGRRRSFVLSLIGLALFLAWWLVAEHLWSFAIFAVGFGVWYGSFAALAPALTADYFGTRHAGAIIGILYTALVPGALLGPTVAGAMYDARDSYTVPIVASIVIMSVAVLCALLLPDEDRERAPVALPTPGVAS